MQYPGSSNMEGLTYSILALSGEVGEVANEQKKILREQLRVIPSYRKLKLLLELGDVLWYLDAVAFELETTLEEIADLNVEKLTARRAQANG